MAESVIVEHWISFFFGQLTWWEQHEAYLLFGGSLALSRGSSGEWKANLLSQGQTKQRLFSKGPWPGIKKAVTTDLPKHSLLNTTVFTGM